MDRIRYTVLGTIDEDGCTRTSPVYFVPTDTEALLGVDPDEPPLTQPEPG